MHGSFTSFNAVFVLPNCHYWKVQTRLAPQRLSDPDDRTICEQKLSDELRTPANNDVDE